MANIIVSKDHLVSRLLEENEDLHDKVVLSVNFNGELTGNSWIVVFDLIFDEIKYRTTGISKKYLLGCETGTLYVKVKDAVITDHTGEKALAVTYNDNNSISDESGLTVKPEIKISEAEVALGSITKNKSSTSGNEKSYILNNHIIFARRTEKSVKWKVAHPNVKKVGSEQVIGNFYFLAEIEWNNDYKEGTIQIEPAKIYFYTTEGKRMDDEKTKMMRLALKILGKRKILHPNGVTFKYWFEK